MTFSDDVCILEHVYIPYFFEGWREFFLFCFCFFFVVLFLWFCGKLWDLLGLWLMTMTTLSTLPVDTFINIFLFHQIHLSLRFDYNYRCYMTLWCYFRYIVVISFMVTIMTWSTVTEQNVCVTDDHLYVLFVIITMSSLLPHSWLLTGLLTWVRRCVLLTEQGHAEVNGGFEFSIFILLCSVILPLSICSYFVASTNKLYIFR